MRRLLVTFVILLFTHSFAHAQTLRQAPGATPQVGSPQRLQARSLNDASAATFCHEQFPERQRDCIASYQKFKAQPAARSGQLGVAAPGGGGLEYTCGGGNCYCHDEHLFNAFDCWSMWLAECTGPPQKVPGSGGVVKCEADN